MFSILIVAYNKCHKYQRIYYWTVFLRGRLKNKNITEGKILQFRAISGLQLSWTLITLKIRKDALSLPKIRSGYCFVRSKSRMFSQLEGTNTKNSSLLVITEAAMAISNIFCHNSYKLWQFILYLTLLLLRLDLL